MLHPPTIASPPATTATTNKNNNNNEGVVNMMLKADTTCNDNPPSLTSLNLFQASAAHGRGHHNKFTACRCSAGWLSSRSCCDALLESLPFDFVLIQEVVHGHTLFASQQLCTTSLTDASSVKLEQLLLKTRLHYASSSDSSTTTTSATSSSSREQLWVQATTKNSTTITEVLWDLTLFPIRDTMATEAEGEETAEEVAVVAMGVLIRVVEERACLLPLGGDKSEVLLLVKRDEKAPEIKSNQEEDDRFSSIPQSPSITPTGLVQIVDTSTDDEEEEHKDKHKPTMATAPATMIPEVNLDGPVAQLPDVTCNLDGPVPQPQQVTKSCANMMVDSCVNSMVLIDPAGTILDHNRTFYQNHCTHCGVVNDNDEAKSAAAAPLQEEHVLQGHNLWNLWKKRPCHDASTDDHENMCPLRQLQQKVAQVIATEQLVEMELQCYCRGDSTTATATTWRHYRISPAKNNNDATDSSLVLLEEWDITRTKELQLADNHTQHFALFQHLPIAYCMAYVVIDDTTSKAVDYIILEINTLFEEMTGLKKENAIGKRVTELLPGIEKDPADWIGRAGKVVQQDSVHRFTQFSEPLQRWYSGVTYRYNHSSSGDNDSSSNSRKCAWFFVDCTENLQMQEMVRETEERHQTLFENMKQGVVYHAADGMTTAANKSALRILGLTMDQMLGKTPMDPQWRFCYEDGRTIPVEEYPAVVALTGKPVTNLIMGVHNPVQSTINWIQLDAMPRFRPGEDKPYQAYTIFNDITESKQIERDLLRAKEKAEEADQLKSAFLATMSHEIRHL